MSKETFFERNLRLAKQYMAYKPSETYYVSNYLPNLINHLQDIKSSNPDITVKEVQDILFKEIDDYSCTVFENSFAFPEYMEYTCCKYLIAHPKKYKEISEKIKKVDIDLTRSSFEDCTSLDEYLSIYVYRYKKSILECISDGYFKLTPENIRNLDEIIQENLKNFSKVYFDEHFSLPQVSDVLTSETMKKSEKVAALKQFSSLYKSPIDRKDFLFYSSLFLEGSYVWLESDLKLVEDMIRKELSKSTVSIIDKLNSLGVLEKYLASYVSQMITSGFSEFAIPFCRNDKANVNYLDSLKDVSNQKRLEILKDVVSLDKLKAQFSENSFNSSKRFSLEQLLAMNTFWANRYIKELMSYSKGMFVIHEHDIISKVLNGQPIDISLEDIEKSLIKMNTFYEPGNNFLDKKEKEITESLRNQEPVSEDKEDDRIIWYSRDPFLDSMEGKFGEEYTKYFSEVSPELKHSIRTDADWAIRLLNPINSSYSIKDTNICALVASIDSSSMSSFDNAGILVDNFSDDKTFAHLPSNICLMIDAELTFPVKIHIKKNVLVDFLKSLNGNAMIPIYEGAEDFKERLTGNLMSTQIAAPLTEKHKTILKKSCKNLNKYKNPNFVSHLGLNNRYIPKHLQTTYFDERGRQKQKFITRYVNLETGDVFEKIDGDYLKVKPVTLPKKGNTEHEI